MKARSTRAQTGFTLVEAMLASLILMLSLASVLALGARGFRYMGDMRRWARSSQVLQQKMEDIRLITTRTNVWALNNKTFSDASIAGTSYRGTIAITPYSSGYPTDFMARVTLLVTWTNSTQQVVTNRLSSVVCKNGLNKYIF
jgi:Tfp pilus assembly protein PilV